MSGILKIRITLLLFVLAAFWSLCASGQDSVRYTQERPLVYEDVWDLWPYSYLNEEGKPEGFNIDLIEMMMKELDIPYVIKLKPSSEAFRDLKDGKSDLMLGLQVGFHDEFGRYSENAVTLFTQSLVRPKNSPLKVQRFHDLSDQEVIVNDSSLAHHLMVEYGWGDNAQPYEDMREAIQKVSQEERGQILWNTLSLKWLMRRYHTDNLELTPVNMQHGAYKFMSNDQKLLDMLDDTYTRLYAAERLTPIQNKWFYPEQQEKGIPQWVWWLTGSIALLILVFSVYAITYRIQARRLTANNEQRNRRLALILQSSLVRIWTYDIKTKLIACRQEDGQVAHHFTLEEFEQRFLPEDFPRMNAVMEELVESRAESGQPEREVTMTLKVNSCEEEAGWRDHLVKVSVLARDKQGHATTLIGTMKDISHENEQQRLDRERTKRYWAVFDSPMAGILLFDKHGRLVNINPKACEMLCCDAEEMIEANVMMDDLIDRGSLAFEELDGLNATQMMDMDKIPAEQRKVPAIKRKGCLHVEFHLSTVFDDNHELIGVFAICRDVTEQAELMEEQRQVEQELERTKAELDECDRRTDSIVSENNLRLVTYSPSSHTLTIRRSMYDVQHELTQTRCMTLVDEPSKTLAMHALNDMDARIDKQFHATIITPLRVKGGLKLCVQFCLMPLYDADGRVNEYFGLCSDHSELYDIQQRTAIEAAKVQEVEDTKNSFVRNMVQEIRKPMNAIIDEVAELDDHQQTAEDAHRQQDILDNAAYLLHFIDNILYLSRLEAHMVEIHKTEQDFASIFAMHCSAGWDKYKNTQTRYVVEEPYEKLVVDIDAERIGHAISQVTANAAQHTKSGVVRARYDYIGRRLMIIVDDSGEGIAPKELERINHEEGTAHTTKGLGLAICRELIRQMGGTLEINSEEGEGTTVYMTISCHASVIKRKKL